MKFWGKVLALLAISSVFHNLYKLVGQEWVKLIAPTDESVFQHMRMIFFAYSFYSLGEYFFLRKKIKSLRNYLSTRFLMLAIFPWLMTVIYLLPQVFTGKMPSEGWEVVLAISTTTIFWLLVILLEKDLEKIRYSQTAAVVLTLIFLLLILTYTIFTFTPPVYDIFAEPIVSY